MYDQDDKEMLESVKKFNSRKKKSFSNEINRLNLSDDEMDDLFLS